MTQQPPPQPGQPYGGQPYPGQPGPGAAGVPTGPPPSTVRLARTLAFVLVGWVALRLVLLLVLQGSLLDSYAEARVEADGRSGLYDFYRDGAPAFVGQAVITLVLVVPVLAAAFFYLRRARWAQVLATVFGVLVLVLGLLALLAGYAPFWWGLLGVLTSLIALAAVVPLYLGPSRAWFGKRAV